MDTATPRWRVLPTVVLVLTAVVFVAVILQGRRFNEHQAQLRTVSAPSMMVSLQLATSTTAAAQILTEWRANGALGCALVNLDLDRTFIALYSLLGILVAIWGVVSIPVAWRSRGLTSLIVLLPTMGAVAGIVDMFENVQLGRQVALAASDMPPAALSCPAAVESITNAPVLANSHDFGTVVARTRIFAVSKFLLLMAAGTGLLIIAGVHVVRRRTRGSSTDGIVNGSFEALVSAELTAIRPERPSDDSLETDAGPAGEHWVSYRNSEVVGLALSGGGIRSATFNLGLLQGLARLQDGKVLGFIDYLSTVSGGGYVGGAWSALICRPDSSTTGREFFVRADQPRSRGGSGETEPVRHLREFSNFLVPRWGFFNVESWQAFIAIVGAVLPSLLIAIAVLLVGLLAYLASTIHTALDQRWPGLVFTTLVTAVVLFMLEVWWRRSETGANGAEQESLRTQRRVHLTSSAAAVALVPFILGRVGQPQPPCLPHAPDGWAATLGIGCEIGKDWWFNAQLLEPALALGICAILLLAGRLVLMLLRRTGGGEPVLIAFDRTLMRIVGLAVVFAALAAVWHLGVNLQALKEWVIALTVASGGAFALLRNWFPTLHKPQAAGVLDRVKPLLPQVLAYGTMILGTAAIASTLVQFAGRDIGAWLAVISATALVLTVGLFVDPQTFGLHSFYRDRIARAYVGASNPLAATAVDNRQFYVRPEDDVRLEALHGRPHHLVCCAANDLAADQVGSLSRGARSAALSQQGIAVGNFWASAGNLSLASALTASAAAFNSNMGHLSVKLGPGVTFLMSALNLRLGLWIRHPRSSRALPMALPGLLFYKEMFQATAESKDDVHLSDGAHFENLGLYELVRRHCRFIIVSDATADPEVAFDDFGIAARRIRQDFGVDIQIDLAPLRPDADGYSRQHMVVGSIEYGSLDQGILLYFKPTLTGDEDPDIRQYRRRNRSFPHETTGDQFYDEAQWESYRRLGTHVADEALRFLNRIDPANVTPQSFFTEARREWYPTSPDLAARVIAMTSRLTAIETDLRSDDAAAIAREVFPELSAIAPTKPEDTPPPTSAQAARTESISLSWILRVLQLMEDAWVECDLDSQWNHPLNLGWMNVFARWATAPTFQMWWPVLSPMYGSGFLRFMHERFPVLDTLSGGKGTITREEGAVPPGIASNAWQHVLGRPVPTGGQVWSYTIELVRGRQKVPLQVGLVAMSVSGGVAQWKAEEFFVPPSLWSGGIGSAFLAKLLSIADMSPGKDMFDEAIHKCRVTISSTSKADPASRAEQRGYLDFYRPKGFELRRVDNSRHEFELVRKSVTATRPATPA